METLRLGSKGPLVERWKNFLRGLNLFQGEVNDEFDEATKDATEQFQTLYRLGVDGVAGNETIGRAMVNGFELVSDASGDRHSPNWPPPPLDLVPMNQASRQSLFGAFSFKPAPTSDNPEGILITDDWQKNNITMVEIPQLKTVKYTPGNQRIAWNVKVTGQIVALFAAWEAAGLMPLVLTWAGSWNPRFIRGSRTNLSNHAWGTAFDINAPWNGLGARPALVGNKGSVRELVHLANQHGLFWGGHFGGGRSDGMHFEVAKVL
jgi:hypothetical protein